jgi:hypothetical protein
MNLNELITIHTQNFQCEERIHRKNNIKPYKNEELNIYYSDELGIILVPKKQIDFNNELILPTNADLLVKYNYEAIKDIEVNIFSFYNFEYLKNYSNSFKEKLAIFFIDFFCKQ